MGADGSRKPFGLNEIVALIWFALDAGTHLSIERLYVLFTLVSGGAAYSKHPLAFIWTEYGKADKRWEVYDPTVLSLELLTVFIMGPLALLAMYGIWARKPWRHVVQIIICACELYGGAMTFFPEWLARPTPNPNLSATPVHFWVYLLFMNGVWVLVPAILLVDSCIVLTRAASTARIGDLAARPPPSGNFAYWLIAGTLALYAVLVPAVIMTANQ